MAAIFKYSQTHHDYFTKSGEKVIYKKGHLLVDSITKSSYVYFLENGILKAVFNSADGTERLLGFFFPGTTFAQSGSFFDNPTSGIAYELVETSTLYRVSSDEFFKKLNTNNEFTVAYLQTVLQNNLFLIERIIYQGEKDINAKFLKWLMFMSKFYGIDLENKARLIPISMTQDTISNFLHSTRESINRVFFSLKKEGYISVKHKQITINDVEKFQKYCNSKV